MKKIMSVIAIMLCITVTLIGCKKSSEKSIDTLRTYAEENRVLTFGQVYSFDWDTGYIDVQTYGTGSALKEKYEIEFNVERLDVDHLNRMLFFNGDKLVMEIQYDFSYVNISSSSERFYPNTSFNVEWENTRLNLHTETIE